MIPYTFMYLNPLIIIITGVIYYVFLYTLYTCSCLLCNHLRHFVLFLQPRKLSAHNVFAGERLREAEVPGLNTELIKEIPSLWKALSDDEKQVHTYEHSSVYSGTPLNGYLVYNGHSPWF